MPTVADCLRQHSPAYCQRHGESVPIGHRKVISSITRCRTGQLGHVLFQCDRCRKEHWAARSCGNRHCPNCQKQKTRRWLEKQTSRLLPVHHFLVTFTVPSELRSVLRSNQREGYRAIFDCGAATIRDVAGASRYLKDCQLGFFGVLHTWGRDPMVYHPHVHFVVPGGGVNMEESRWQSTPENFFLPHGAMCRVYKAKFADRMRELDLYGEVDSSAWMKTWTVDIEAVGDGRAVYKYLAPYVYRVAISDSRIVDRDDDSVTYRYRPSGARVWKTRCVAGTEFVRGFVQHTLPSGFQKSRYYGWLSPNSKTSIDEVRWLVFLYLGWTYLLASRLPKTNENPNRLRCQGCGGDMVTIAIFDGEGKVLFQNALGYLDSG